MDLSGDQWICVIFMICATVIIVAFVVAAAVSHTYEDDKDDHGP